MEKVVTVLHQTNGERTYIPGQDPVVKTRGIEYFHYARVTLEEMKILESGVKSDVQRLLNNL